MLTFPIENTSPSAIKSFDAIYATYGHLIGDLDGMIKYLCYRFDPKSEEVRAAVGRDAKREMAERLSGWSRPEPSKPQAAEDDEIQESGEWMLYMEVESMFLRLAWSIEYVFMESTEEAIYNSMDVVRRPIPPDTDEETQGKMVLNIQKATSFIHEAIGLLRKMQDSICDLDGEARENMESELRKARVFRDATGKKISK